MSWLSRLLLGAQSPADAGPAAPDFAGLVADVHSHLLPGVDDGAATLPQTLALLRGFAALGYRHLITTPHIHSASYPNRADDLRARHAALLAQPEVEALLREHRLRLELAAEYYLDEHFLELLERGELLTFGPRMLLIETHHQQRNVGLAPLVRRLVAAGYTPVLAHPERYAYGWHEPKTFLPLREAGLLLQVNITAFTGHYGKSIRRTAEQLADWNAVDLLGSDCHKLEHQQLMRQALASPALQRLLASPVLRNPSLASSL